MNENADRVDPEVVAHLRRKVAWQVATAYGLPLEDEPAMVVPVSLDRPVTVVVKTAPRPQPASLPTLDELEGLVAAAAHTDPERAEEWRWYLFYLRGFAHADGTLDDGFRLLIETAFAPLVERTA